MPGAPSSFLFLVVWPGAPSSVLATGGFNDEDLIQYVLRLMFFLLNLLVHSLLCSQIHLPPTHPELCRGKTGKVEVDK